MSPVRGGPLPFPSGGPFKRREAQPPRRGRKSKHIEVATELQLVAQPRQRSFTLDLELARLPECQLAEAGPHVGEQALDALVAVM